MWLLGPSHGPGTCIKTGSIFQCGFLLPVRVKRVSFLVLRRLKIGYGKTSNAVKCYGTLGPWGNGT